MVNGKDIFNVHWPNSLGLIEGFCTVCEQPWVDLNPRPFAQKATTLTTAPRRPHTKQSNFLQILTVHSQKHPFKGKNFTFSPSCQEVLFMSTNHFERVTFYGALRLTSWCLHHFTTGLQNALQPQCHSAIVHYLLQCMNLKNHLLDERHQYYRTNIPPPTVGDRCKMIIARNHVIQGRSKSTFRFKLKDSVFPNETVNFSLVPLDRLAPKGLTVVFRSRGD